MDDVIELVRGRLSKELAPYVNIAEALQLVPWAVLSACHRLVREGVAQEGKDNLRGHFRLAASTN